jgi:hypothetical protein
MYRIDIHSTSTFLCQWHMWVEGQVRRLFKRDHERVMDMTQNVRVRILQKDVISRWFLKHMTGELVVRSEAERMLGKSLSHATYADLKPVRGKKSDPESVWLVSDILNHAKFDRESYFYCIQDHLIDSDTVLSLLGYEPGRYSALQSLVRSGKLLPSDFTDHTCSKDESCPDCQMGRQALFEKGLSLSQDWNKSKHAADLRWNDSQLRPYLRNWNGRNRIFAIPSFIVRDTNDGVTAGLLKYVSIIINNEVTNQFKTIRRNEESSCGVGVEHSTSDLVTISTSEEDLNEVIFKDPESLRPFEDLDSKRDVKALMAVIDLTDQELDVLNKVQFGEHSSNSYAKASGLNAPRVGRILNMVVNKFAQVSDPMAKPNRILHHVLHKYGVSRDELFGNDVVGLSVLARAEFFSSLYDNDMPLESISTLYNVDIDLVTAGINRHTIREFRSEASGI